LTGILTIPKLIDPLQIALAIAAPFRMDQRNQLLGV
jgi:hypothetical protein